MSWVPDRELETAIAAFNIDGYLRAKGWTLYGEGKEVHMDCPRCGGKQKLYVNRITKMFICFKCPDEFRGGLIKLISTLDRMTWSEAANYVRSAYTGPRVRSAPISIPAPVTREAAMPENYRKLTDPNDPRQKPYWDYALNKRRLTVDQVLRYGMGFCLLGPYAFRLIVPIINYGRLFSFVARDITGRSDRKVLTPPENLQKKALFNLDSLHGHESVVIVEGVFDALRADDRCVASLGKTLSATQQHLLRQAGVRRLVFAWDEDAYRETTNVAWRLASLFEEVKVALLPKGVDPSDMDEKAFRRVLDEAEKVKDLDILAATRGRLEKLSG